MHHCVMIDEQWLDGPVSGKKYNVALQHVLDDRMCGT